jgi:hypothetical protein
MGIIGDPMTMGKRLFSIYANLGGPDHVGTGEIRSMPKKKVYQAETA